MSLKNIFTTVKILMTIFLRPTNENCEKPKSKIEQQGQIILHNNANNINVASKIFTVI